MEVIYRATLTVAAMAVLTALLEFLLPQSKLKPCVSIAIGIIFVLSIAAPVVSLCAGRTIAPDFSALPFDKQPEQEAPSYQAFMEGLYEAASQSDDS